MIPTIGIMVAAIGVVVCLYVLTRISDLSEAKVGGGVRFMCVVTAIAAVLAIAVLGLLATDLAMMGTEPQSLPSF